MELYCNVYFHRNFKGPKSFISEVEKEYMDRRDYAVELLNDLYEKWNAEFDRLYPDVNGESKEYAVFISKKEQIILDAVNELPFTTNHILLKASDDIESLGDIYCVLRQNKKAKMFMTIKVIE